VGQPGNQDSTPQNAAITVGNRVDDFLHDPTKFIEMFVRNRERSRP
jgi:hypothetical protein